MTADDIAAVDAVRRLALDKLAQPARETDARAWAHSR